MQKVSILMFTAWVPLPYKTAYKNNKNNHKGSCKLTNL